MQIIKKLFLHKIKREGIRKYRDEMALSTSNISLFRIVEVLSLRSPILANPRIYIIYIICVKLSRFADRLFVFHAKTDYDQHLP